MPSRLTIFFDQVIELGWLAALICAPLFFNVYSSRVFEPDKITLVRSIALVMTAGWIVQQIERGLKGLSPRAWLSDNPLMLPTLALVLANVISTVLSLVPATSFWGSYQRLQGLDSLLSYIVIFYFAASRLRTHEQFDRAINTILLVSFPVAYYGLLQHYSLDPLPWGGDVTSRVASNMGNSIFVAAYLIMALPMTLARWIETLNRMNWQRRSPNPSTPETSTGPNWILIAALSLAMISLAVVWTIDFWIGLAWAVLIVLGTVLAAFFAQLNRRDALLASVYSVHFAALLVGIFFTQSRGPWLGLAGGLFTFAILYSLARGARKLVFALIALGAIVTFFLGVLNLPTSPLDPLKKIPYLGRLGNILETESGTGKVRELIWQGDIPLLMPHAPLWSPTTGDDVFNVLRPLIGYGPEAMYVAYNSFYPPDLAHLEARNASPDRSHNETFDALVTTGVIGFVAYILLFISIFYFGMKSLGLIQSIAQRNAFIALWLGGGLLSTISFGLLRGWYFLGVALPFGMITGLIIFLVCDVLWGYRPPKSAGNFRLVLWIASIVVLVIVTFPLAAIFFLIVHFSREQPDVPQKAYSIDSKTALWISALLAAFIAHFIEINFGIAIVSTRTYFWFYAALMVVLGLNRLSESIPALTPQPTTSIVPEDRRLSRRERRNRAAPSIRPAGPRSEGSLGTTLVWTLLSTIVFVTLTYEFVTLQANVNNAVDLVWRSLFLKDNLYSPAVFSLFAVTWVLAGILGYDGRLRGEARWLSIAIFAVLSFTITMWFVLFQTRWLLEVLDPRNNGFDRFNNLLGLYYVTLLLAIIVAAYFLSNEYAKTREFSRIGASVMVAPLALLGSIVIIYLTNYTAIASDVLYKAGSNYDANGAWNQSIEVYNRALRLQPDQDFYLLFLGRSYLEEARTATDPKQRLPILQQSQQSLLHAREINPLNTDHSANLARLNRIWATMADNAADKTALLQKADGYYRDATRLSPNTVYLYNEWSSVFMLTGDVSKAVEMLLKSISLDQEFAQTFQLLGDAYASQNDSGRALDAYVHAIALDPGSVSGPDGMPLAPVAELLSKPQFAQSAIDAYNAAAKKSPDSIASNMGLAEIYRRTGKLDLARQQLEQAVKSKPQDMSAELALVNFLSTNGQIDAAAEAMRRVLTLISPQSPDYARMQDFSNQLQQLARAISAAHEAPNDPNPHRALAAIWRSRGQPQFALAEYQIVARLAPTDYDALKNIVLMNLQLNNLDDSQRSLAVAAASAPDPEKAVWQNLQSALNNQRTNQIDRAVQDARAAQAIAPPADQPVIQLYVSALQALPSAK